jgi:hypothetical protein
MASAIFHRILVMPQQAKADRVEGSQPENHQAEEEEETAQGLTTAEAEAAADAEKNKPLQHRYKKHSPCFNRKEQNTENSIKCG